MTPSIFDRKSTKHWLASSLAFVLLLSMAALLPLNNKAHAMGPGPSGCAGSEGSGSPEYESTITAFTVNNGQQTYDVLANPGITIPVDVDEGYHVDFILHTYDYGFRPNYTAGGQREYETSSDVDGSIWYNDSTVGYSQTKCVGPVQGNQDKVMSLDLPVPSCCSGDNTFGKRYIHFQANPHSDSGDFVLQTVEFYIDVMQDLPAGDTNSELTVNTENRDGNPIYGYWTVLSQDGNTVGTGFSPATFTLDNGENYVISVADYGQYAFDYWQDTGSTVRDRSISISSDTSITAVYRNVNEPATPTPPDDDTAAAQSAITVRTIDDAGDSEIYGYYTVLYDGNGAVLDTGFSPATFDVTSGQTYTVEVQDYGSYYFNYWQDNSDTDRGRTITATDNEITLTAVYSTSPSATPPPDEEEQPPEQTAGEISVTTVYSSGNQIYGYYTTLSQNGQVIQSAFSPAEFTVSTGQTYQVAVADYGSYAFDHWSDGSYDRFHDAQAGDELVAVYRTY